MDDLFLLFMLVSFGAFITALINPLVFQKIFKNKATRKNLSIYFIGSSIIFFVLFGITTDPVEQITKANTLTKINQEEQVILNLEQQKNEKEVIKEQSTSEVEQQKDEVKLVEEQDETDNSEKQDEVKKIEIIPIPNEEKTESQEEIKSTNSIDIVQNPTYPKTEDKPVQVIIETISQKNAVKKAKSYLGYSAFSHGGLTDQLKYEQFSQADAIYGANNSNANWNNQAIKKAKSYLDTSAFSYNGLIEQLKYDKFTEAQAKYGADNCGANWNKQAAKKAKSYMEYSAFSRGSLIDQLKYDKFTQAQAEYGVDAVEL